LVSSAIARILLDGRTARGGVVRGAGGRSGAGVRLRPASPGAARLDGPEPRC